MRKLIESHSKAIARNLRAAVITGLTGFANLANAGFEVNIPPPASSVAHQIYNLHFGILVVCAIIFVVVFAAMFYSLFAFRKSRGAKADVNFHENTLIEIIWTVIPFIILIGMAIPATKTILSMKDTSNPDITIKVTGYQWGWNYDYSQDGVNFYSNLATPWSQIGNPDSPATEAKNPNYLLEVDKPLVVPAGKRVRLLVTSNDVIHGWYVPQLGINQYGIPGFIKDAWFTADQPGTYRGQCSQICGKLHGYMPITVEVKSAADYDTWMKEAKTKWASSATSAAADASNAAPVADSGTTLTEDANKTYTLAELKANGEKVYAANCVACHQANGKGLPPAFPSLDGSKIVSGPKAAQIALLMSGKTGTAMVSFARLTDLELASVLTYERNSWGNKTGEAIQPAEFKAARK